MPIKTETDVSGGLTVHAMTGQVGFVEIMETLKAFWKGPNVTPNVIWDSSRAVIEPVEASQLCTLPYYAGSVLVDRRKGGKTAIITSGNGDDNSSRIIQAGRAGKLPWEFAVFRSMEEALEWVNGNGDQAGGQPDAPKGGGGPEQGQGTKDREKG